MVNHKELKTKRIYYNDYPYFTAVPVQVRSLKHQTDYVFEIGVKLDIWRLIQFIKGEWV
jgi:hypothetical protein